LVLGLARAHKPRTKNQEPRTRNQKTTPCISTFSLFTYPFSLPILIFPKSIAANERWYWALCDEAGKISPRLVRATETNETSNSKG
jgi:hypothetical protein